MRANTDESLQSTSDQPFKKRLAFVGVEDLTGVSVRFGNQHLVEIECIAGMLVLVHPEGRIVIHGPHKSPV